ncbi:MAG: SPL family radical SAM protein [Myxococcaceae bacterium]
MQTPTSVCEAETRRYADSKVRSLLRQESEGGERWHWALNPYEGCEFACAFCRMRLDRKDFAGWRSFERDIGVKTNAVEALLRDLREQGLCGRELVLGSATDPWQPAEEHFRLTRAILAALGEVQGVSLRANTRSSLVARDTDLLKHLATRGKVTVAMSIASLDERMSLLLEPRAPTPFRRLAAMEALSRAGIEVGLIVSPVMPGLSERELGLEKLLTRAANAGARSAGISMMHFDHPGQREWLMSHLASAYPQLSFRLRRVIGHRARTDEERRSLLASFDDCCLRLGLAPLLPAIARKPPPRGEPSQLGLFDAPEPH